MPTIRKKPKPNPIRQNLSANNFRGKRRITPTNFPLSNVHSEASGLTVLEKAYLPDIDLEFWSELRLAWCRLWKQAEDTGASLIPAITRHTETGWHVEERSVPFKIPLIHKAKGRATKYLPDSISRIVPITIHAPADREAAFFLTAEIITLSWSTADTVNRHSHSIWHVGDGTADGTVEAFFTAPRLLSEEVRQAAKAAGSKKWRAARDERIRVIEQVRTQIPITKTVFGVGAGEELRRIALVKPQHRVRLAKRDPNSLSREDVIDGYWDEAVRLGLSRPQRVKI